MLTIGLPLVGDLPQECVTDLMVAVAQAAKIEEQLVFICPQNVYPHDRARELIITEALKMESTKLWFIDADTRPPEGAFEKMLGVLNEKKCALVSGYYVQRGYPFVSTWAKYEENSGPKLTKIDDDVDVLRINACGLGCALIDLSWVKENLQPPFFLMEADPALPTMYRWEDAYFCKKIADAGGEIYGLTDVECTHMGRRMELTPQSAQAMVKGRRKSE